MMMKHIKHLVTISRRRHLETLSIIAVVCLASVAVAIINVSTSSRRVPAIPKTTATNGLVFFDYVINALSLLHAVVQVTQCTRNMNHILNVSTYFLCNAITFLCLTTPLLPNKSIVIKFGLPTLIFMFDWKKCVLAFKSSEQHSICNTSILAVRLFNKSMMECMFFVLGLYSNVGELSQLSAVVCTAAFINCINFVTLLPALNKLQQQMLSGNYHYLYSCFLI